MLTSKESKPKFALKMADGAEVRNIDDLKAHFDINSIVDYFCDGTLLAWLEARYYDEEADAVRELSRHDKQLKQKLCAIFEMESAEQIAWCRERLERLRQYTDDENILACVERVAFDQEDLAELLDEGTREIFLCANRFVIPLRMTGKTYIGVGGAVAVIRSKKVVDFAALNITFKGVGGIRRQLQKNFDAACAAHRIKAATCTDAANCHAAPKHRHGLKISCKGDDDNHQPQRHSRTAGVNLHSNGVKISVKDSS